MDSCTSVFLYDDVFANSQYRLALTHTVPLPIIVSLPAVNPLPRARFSCSFFAVNLPVRRDGVPPLRVHTFRDPQMPLG